jgi:hypothetical protein
METPRFQFGTSSILLVTAVVSISLAGAISRLQTLERVSSWLLVSIAVMGPFWVPIAFMSFCAGRGRISAQSVAFLASIEFVAVALSFWLMP